MAPVFKMKKDLLRFCHLLYQRNLMVSVDGNVSIRTGDGYITTPAGRNKGLIDVEDLVLLDREGLTREEGKRPSSEFKMHKRVYDHRDDVHAVVHCHPVYATVFAASSIELDDCLLTESVVSLGQIPKAPLALPSTNEIPDSITPFLKSSNAILLANHGVLTYGSDLEQAYSRMEAVEHFAKISYLTRLANIQNNIPGDQVGELENLRSRYGLDSHFTPCTTKETTQKGASKEDQIVELVTRIVRDMR